jgi:uncharacterized protein (TIGR02246 family)
VERQDVDRWLERYVAAWKSGDPAEIGDLFSEDAQYRYYPGDTPLAGRDAIVASWLDHEDEPGTFDASYSCWALDGDRAVAVGTSTYTAPEQKVYDNAFLLVFDGDGRCADFAELYLKRPQDG